MYDPKVNTIFKPEDALYNSLDEIITKLRIIFDSNMKMLALALEQFDEIKDTSNAPNQKSVLANVQKRTENMMFLVHQLDQIVDRLPNTDKLTQPELIESFDLISEIRRLIKTRIISQNDNKEVIQ